MAQDKTKEHPFNEKYSYELKEINSTLLKIYNGEIFELTQKIGHCKHTTLAKNLEEDINDLLDKVVNNSPSSSEIAREEMKKLDDLFSKEDKNDEA